MPFFSFKKKNFIFYLFDFIFELSKIYFIFFENYIKSFFLKQNPRVLKKLSYYKLLIQTNFLPIAGMNIKISTKKRDVVMLHVMHQLVLFIRC